MSEQGRLLDADEARVLGVLLEKEQTTPDAYPLTINAVIAGCNQKSNRDPVVLLTETEVVEALDRLRADVLAWRTTGPRAEKWEHSLTRRWHLIPKRKAVLTLLLLRGPQTPGELKGRSERMTSFEDVGDVERVLAEMAAGPEGLVHELPRVPGQRGRRWIHLLSAEQELSSSASVQTHESGTEGRGLETSSFRTADLIDDHTDELQSCQTQFRLFGRRRAFSGRISTIRCLEDNQLVRDAVAETGVGRVLVIDGAGSLRSALVGDLLAEKARASGWSGIVVHGAIRDSEIVDTLDLGVKALGTNPRKSAKTGAGERDVMVEFGDVVFEPGSWLWSDEDGIVIADRNVLES